MKLAFAVLASLFLVAACSSYDKDERVDPGVGQSGTDFYPVALVVVDRCGSIDCHGSKYRNMRLYGYSSERLNPLQNPDSPETTSQDEADEDYNAIVSLEPLVFQEVIRQGGAAPDRLMFVRKARGQEDHKGGGRIVEGDDADLCIQSWLQSKTDAARCKLAVPRLNKEN